MTFNKITTLNISDDFKSKIDNLGNLNVASAAKLTTGRTISLSGDINGSIIFDGTSDVIISAVTKASGVTAGTYTKVTVDSKGYVTSATNATASDVGLGNVTNESKSTMFTSPNFTGAPLAPTPTAGDSSTKIATTAFVSGAIASAVAGNVNSATKLQTARHINGVLFDGTSDITITAAPTAHTHDDRYYTESEIDSRLSILGSFVYGSTLPDVTLRNANSLYFKVTG
jgi:phage-related tail fiber protein